MAALPSFTGWINVANFQRTSTETDDTGRLQRAVNVAISHQFASSAASPAATVYIPTGLYTTSAPIYLDGSNPAGSPWNATKPQYTQTDAAIGGTVAVNDTVTLTATSSLLFASPVSVTVTSSSTSTSTLAQQLQAAVLGNPTLAALVNTQRLSATLTLYAATGAGIAWTYTASGSETITFTTHSASTATAIVAPQIRLIGDGAFQTVITAALSGNYGAFYFPANGGSYLVEPVFEIFGIAFYGNAAPTGGGNQTCGVQLAGADYATNYLRNVTIKDCYFKWFWAAISVATSYGTSISGVRIETCIRGIYLYDSGAAAITDCDMSANTALTGAGAGIHIAGNNSVGADHLSEFVTINGVTVNSWQIGLYITDQSFGSCTNSSFTTNPGSSLVTQRPVEQSPVGASRERTLKAARRLPRYRPMDILRSSSLSAASL